MNFERTAHLRKLMLIPMLAAAMPAISWAQTDARERLSRDTRLLRQDARGERREAIRSMVAPTSTPVPTAEPQVQWDFSLGLAYTHGDDGSRTTNTPFELAASMLPDKKAVFKLQSDGYAHSRLGGATASGFSDVNLSGSYAVVKEPGVSLRLGAGLKLGSRSDVGSDSNAGFVSASYTRVFAEQFVGTVIGKLRRDFDDAPPGISRNVRTGVLQLAYNFKEPQDTDVFAQVVRSHRSGAGGATFAVLGTDFPLSRFFAGSAWGGSLSVSRGLTSGARDTGIEFDISRSF